MKKTLWRTCFLILICLMVVDLSALQATDTVGAEEPGFHGMLIIGSKSIYMSHLPMFVPQHRYQGLWEVSFGEAGDQKYRVERQRPENAGRIFTLAPRELFRLPELNASRDSFSAALFIGHFEREGRELLLDNITVTLKRRIHWHPFRNRHSRPKQFTGVLFGEGDETFFSHWITVSPNYHQILTVTVSEPIEESAQGVQIVLVDHADRDPLKAGHSVTGHAILNGDSEQPIRVQPVKLHLESEFYLEQGELAQNGLGEER